MPGTVEKWKWDSESNCGGGGGMVILRGGKSEFKTWEGRLEDEKLGVQVSI
jgi:hypothetical protein